jgi:type VI protein secretion system component Hcp
MSDTPNPTSAVVLFIILTTIYAPVKYYLNKPKSNETDNIEAKSNHLYLGIYILCLTIGEFVINLSLTNSMCGGTQWGTALLVTLIPWIVIFGSINVLLIVFPGWLGPFSNTFGYMIAKFAGINTLINKIFKPKMEQTDASAKDKDMINALANIYGNKSLLINQISVQDFNKFWTTMSPLFKSEVSNNSELKMELFNMVRLKTIVSEYIWLILTGIYVTSVSYNYIINSKCAVSERVMENKDKEYTEKQEEKQANNEEEPRVYITGE